LLVSGKISAPGPAGGPFAAPEDGRQPFRQRRRAPRHGGRHQSEAAERRSAHEFRSGDEDDRSAFQIIGDARRGDPRLAGVDDEADLVAMRLAKPVDIVERRQDQAGLGAVHDMDEGMPSRRPGASYRLVHPRRDVGGRAGPAAIVADRYVDHLDMGRSEPRHRIAGPGRDSERRALGEITAVRRMDAAAADLVGAEHMLWIPAALLPAAQARATYSRSVPDGANTISTSSPTE
jgi:hypothetical protein